MRLLDPETFTDQPYVAGLNQGGHMVAGAALFVVPYQIVGPDFAVGLALMIPLAWEAWQYTERGAVWWDCLLDLLFWYLGAAAWFMAILTGDISGPAILFPLWSVLIMGAVMAVFTIFKARSKGDL